MKYNFLVIGESCKDVFLYGHSDRLSPEAPVPIFTPVEKVTTSGMAGNVLANLMSICKKHEQKWVVELITSDNKSVKTRFVDKKTNHLFLRVDKGDNSHSKFELTDDVKASISQADTILISDYNKGYLTDENISSIKKLSKEGATVFLDTKKFVSAFILESVDFLKLNHQEYKNNLNYYYLLDYEQKIIITNGDKGAIYMGKDYPVKHPQTTIDVSGAGDTFLAALAYKYTIDKDIKKAVNFANEMASLVVTKKGVAVV